ncbi:diflavin oxidoreductase [Microvirga flavescens]|uniref:diflavin oxidoreductase n=1 Tax=Microvirga flavescens TaxID=2249811 RepID=UPI000DD9829C|nr:flavodoxin domain-containing protein [Microvirga flavescens]
MASNALIPKTAPFADDAITHLNNALRDTTALQRAWLAGFLAGLDTQGGATGGEVSPQPLATPKPAEPLTIVFASESGNAEQLAQDAAKLARKSGFKPKIIDFADLDVAALAKEQRLIVIAATWGEGEPPSRAARSYAALLAPSAPRLDGVTYGVLALGDTAYAEFCAIGKAIDTRLEELGAKRAVARVDCDLDFKAPASAWLANTIKTLAPATEQASNVVAVDFSARESEGDSNEPFTLEVSEHINLNSSRSDKETFHIAFSFSGTTRAYDPGDSIEIFPQNDPALVDAILAAAGLASDNTLRNSLTAERDITTLSVITVEKYASASGHDGARRLAEDGEIKSWIKSRQLIDLLEEFHAPLTADQLLSLTRPLPPRAYSISSSRREVGDEVHILVSPVRYETHGRNRTGVASGFLADRIKAGETLQARIKPNKHFRLPDPSTDIIMIGPGTGVAPFRSFIQERRAVSATGRSWLFFGERRYTHDFLYQLEWQDALAEGALTRLDVAFSRDTPQKIYVQDKLWAKRRDVVDWLDNGARLYVCGDASAMAKDVRKTLVHLVADVKSLSPEAAEEAVSALERDRRYLQDVY